MKEKFLWLRIALFRNDILFDSSVQHNVCSLFLFHHNELLKDYYNLCKQYDEFCKEGYESFILFIVLIINTNGIFKQWRNQRIRNCVLEFCNCEMKKRKCEMNIRNCENEKRNCEIKKRNCENEKRNCEILKRICEN